MDKEKSLKLKLKQVLILTLVALSFSKIKTPIMCSKFKTATNNLYNKNFFLNKIKKGNTGIERIKNLEKMLKVDMELKKYIIENKEKYISNNQTIIESIKKTIEEEEK